MNLLKRIFRSYDAEKNKTLSPWQQRQLAVDEHYAMLIQQRDLANEERKNKRQVNATRTVIDKETGKRKIVRYTAGVLATRDHGGVDEKLRKTIGGKAMRRILKRERRLGREQPEALVVNAIDEEGNEHRLTRGVDFTMMRRPFGDPTLVLHDMATNFNASYEASFADELAAR